MVEIKLSDWPANRIALKHGRITLFWPLTLHLDKPPVESKTIDKTMEGFAKELRAKSGRSGSARGWAPVDDPLEHIPRPAKPKIESPEGMAAWKAETIAWENDAYNEAVYFHEFIQSFLYRSKKSEQPQLFDLFRRTDIGGADISFKVSWNQELMIRRRVKIDRLNLYLFRTGVAVLAMDMVIALKDEERAESGWNLAEFQSLHDLVRRTYAPYFPNEKGRAFRQQSDLVVDALTWLDGHGDVAGQNGAGWIFDLGDDIDEAPRYVGTSDTKASRFPPVFRHWRALVADLPLAGYDKCRPPLGTAGAAGCFHHVVDERMPTIATVSVADEGGGQGRYKSISDGDFVRLCFVDKAGTDPFPYDKDFLANFEEKYCYDRFRSSGTRYLMSGYSFVAVIGSSGGEFVSMHMRRHYYQMALLVHTEYASLLGFSGQISRAVDSYRKGYKEYEFEQAMEVIQEQFLQFVHRFRFTGVSNQTQGQELFARFREHLGSDALFADVQEEITAANDFLKARSDSRSTRASELLALIGGVGVVLGLIIGILGMNFIFTGEIWSDGPSEVATTHRSVLLTGLKVTGCVTMVVSLVTGLLLWLTFPRVFRKALMSVINSLGLVFALGFLIWLAGECPKWLSCFGV